MDRSEILWTYLTRDRVLSEEEFKELAEEAKARGVLNQLYTRIKDQVEMHRFLVEHFTLNSELEKAELHKKNLSHVERELAIVEYLHQNTDFSQNRVSQQSYR